MERTGADKERRHVGTGKRLNSVVEGVWSVRFDVYTFPKNYIDIITVILL